MVKSLKAVSGAEQLHERAQQDAKIIRDGVLSLVDSLAQLQARTDTLARDQASRHKLDETSAVAHELLEIPEDKPPPAGENGPAVRDEVPAPAGELTVHPASQPAQQEQLEAGEREDQGDLPRELVEKVPGETGTDPEFDPEELGQSANPTGPRNPAAIGLM
jgi:hypothetical protein